MDHIYNLISDWELTDELSKGLRNRDLEQKFFYLWDGSNIYYDVKWMDSEKMWSTFTNEEWIDMWIKGLDKDKKITFISLGAWNSEIEKGIFTAIADTYKNIKYIAVDSAKKMLEASIKNLKELDIDKRFICVDFSTNVFKRELQSMTQWDDERIFTFFSNTFGNINHTNIIDILYNLLKPGEKIWLDARLRWGTTSKDDMEESEYYYNFFKSEEMDNFFKNILKTCNIPKENGELSLRTEKEASLNALKFKSFFNINKKTNIEVKNESITMLPGEAINLQQIYTYDPDGLINFFQEHGFKLVRKQIKKQRGQFLFEKI